MGVGWGGIGESWSFRQGRAREDGFLIIRKGAYKNLEALDGELINPLTPISDQDRISPYNVNTISSRQVMRIEKNINRGIISQYQILWTNIIRMVWQIVRRITK